MDQREFIYNYNKQNRAPFNKDLFVRDDREIINMIKDVINSVHREGVFTIKPLEIKLIESYDEINHYLWMYEEASTVKKKDLTKELEKSNKQPKKSGSKTKNKNVNLQDYINLNKSAIYLLKVKYFIEITEKKDGLVNDVIEVLIAIPRVVDDKFFLLNGKKYLTMFQVIDASTYNNATTKSSDKQSITFRTILSSTRIHIYKYSKYLTDIDGNEIPCTYFVINAFKKSVLLIKYLLAKFGYLGCYKFLYLNDISIVTDISLIDKENNYIFECKGIYIVIPRLIYDSIKTAQSFVYTIYTIINTTPDINISDLYDNEFYIKSLGSEFTGKNVYKTLEKGLSILESIEFDYDDITKRDLKLTDDDKSDIYRVIRWMMYEFNSLRLKDNLDITTKKVRCAEYIASLYATKLAEGIYRISDKGERANLNTIRKAISTPPMYLINAIINSELVNYNNSVNDLDALISIKYTFKGPSGIGGKSNSVSNLYKLIHPSHLGKLDIDSSPNSDPGTSGVLVPFVDISNGHFSDYQEPSTWRQDISKLMEIYKATNSKVTMCEIINDTESFNKRSNIMVAKECTFITYDLLNCVRSMNPVKEDEGLDIFGDGIMIYSSK